MAALKTFFRGRVGAATGLAQGLDFAKSLGKTSPMEPLARARGRLAQNLALEDEIREGGFARLLQAWGLGEDELASYVRARLKEALFFALLCLVGLVACYANLLFPARVPLVRFLAGLACASFVAASLVMCLAAFWRARVCRTRNFVPFTGWLKGLLPFSRAQGPVQRE